jgi:hypothetical protein
VRRFISLFIAVPAAAVAIVAAGGAVAGAAAGSLPKVTISTDGTSISVGGAVQSGAVNVVTKVTGEPQANPILVRLNPGVTPKRLIDFLHTKAANDPNNVDRFGSIMFDAQAPKGMSTVQTRLQPAKYVAIDAARGPSNAPTASFTVGRAAQPASLPKPDATVKAIDFAFKGPAKLHRGSLVRFKNSGFVAHMNIALPTANGADARKLVKALRTGNNNARKLITGQPLTWLGTVSTGAVQQMKLDAKPGFYVMACFEDTQDGREHTLLGMERAVHVVK